MARFPAAILALALMAGGATAGEPAVRGIKSYAMPAYTIVTNDELSARAVAAEIEKIDKVLGVVLKHPQRVRSSPVYIFLASSSVWRRYLEPRSAIVGEFVLGRFSNYLLIDNGYARGHLHEPLYHEYTHLFLRTQFRKACPLWFDEGLAELMQFTQIRGSRTKVGVPPEPLTDQWLHVDRLLRLDKSSPEYHSPAGIHAVHFESWALVHRGLIAEPEFGRQLFAYLDALDQMQPVESALQTGFGMSAEELNSNLRSYARQRRFKGAVFEIEHPAPKPLVQGVSMSKPEALEFLAEVMFVSGFKPQRLGEVVSAAARQSPGSPNAHVLRMRLAVRDGDDAGLFRLLGEIEPRTSDPQVARGVGLVLAERLRAEEAGKRFQAGAPADLGERTLVLLDRAIRAKPDDPEAVWAHALLAAQMKRYVSTALIRVRQASEQLPSNADLAMAEGLLHEALGESKQAMQRLQDTARFTNSVEQRKWALQRVDRISAGDGGKQPAAR